MCTVKVTFKAPLTQGSEKHYHLSLIGLSHRLQQRAALFHNVTAGRAGLAFKQLACVQHRLLSPSVLLFYCFFLFLFLSSSPSNPDMLVQSVYDATFPFPPHYFSAECINYATTESFKNTSLCKHCKKNWLSYYQGGKKSFLFLNIHVSLTGLISSLFWKENDDFCVIYFLRAKLGSSAKKKKLWIGINNELQLLMYFCKFSVHISLVMLYGSYITICLFLFCL